MRVGNKHEHLRVKCRDEKQTEQKLPFMRELECLERAAVLHSDQASRAGEQADDSAAKFKQHIANLRTPSHVSCDEVTRNSCIIEGFAERMSTAW